MFLSNNWETCAKKKKKRKKRKEQKKEKIYGS